ncbi:MAG: hypothetical protein ACRC7O_07250, partial [Fimbriiglobus sp.]
LSSPELSTIARGPKTAISPNEPAPRLSPTPGAAIEKPTTIEPTKSAPTKPKMKPVSTGSPDDMAAMLLADDDDDSPTASKEVPEGTTVMELTAVDAEKLRAAGVPVGGDKKKAAISSPAETSSAAQEILRKYMKRPK